MGPLLWKCGSIKGLYNKIHLKCLWNIPTGLTEPSVLNMEISWSQTQNIEEGEITFSGGAGGGGLFAAASRF